MNPNGLLEGLGMSGAELVIVGSLHVSSAVISAMMGDAFYEQKSNRVFVTGTTDVFKDELDIQLQLRRSAPVIIIVGLSPARALSGKLLGELRKDLRSETLLLFVSKAFAYEDGIAIRELADQGYERNRIRFVPLANRTMRISRHDQPLTRPLLATSQLLDALVTRARSDELEFADLHDQLIKGAKDSPLDGLLPVLQGNYGHIAALHAHGMSLEDCFLLNDALDVVAHDDASPSDLLQRLHQLTRERPLQLDILSLFGAYRFAAHFFPGLSDVADRVKFRETLTTGEPQVFRFLVDTRNKQNLAGVSHQRARALLYDSGPQQIGLT